MSVLLTTTTIQLAALQYVFIHSFIKLYFNIEESKYILSRQILLNIREDSWKMLPEGDTAVCHT